MMQGLLVVLVICLFVNIKVTHSHSWMACSDYQADLDPNKQDYDINNCEGFGRGYKDSNNPPDFAHGSFRRSSVGLVEGFAECQNDLTFPIEASYDSTYPFGTYTLGSTIRIVWPAKNHAIGEECDEPTSVDRAMAIYVNPQVNPTQDLNDISEYTLIYDWHEASGEDFTSGQGINGIPFANCMDYCNDTDRSPCFGDIIIPDDENNRELFKETGFYTFIWYWEFTEIYVTCYEVYIDLDTNFNTQIDNRDNNKDNGNYFAIYYVNFDSLLAKSPDTTIEELVFEIRDSYYDDYDNNENNWIAGEYNHWGNKKPFIFRNTYGRPWQLPFDVRLTDNNGLGEEIIGLNVITSHSSGEVFDLGTYFGETIKIQHFNINNNRYFGMYIIENEDSFLPNVIIDEIIFEVADRGGTTNEWTTATLLTQGNGIKKFRVDNNIGRPWEFPLSVRLTSDYGNGQVLIGYDVITSYGNTHVKYDFGDNFD